MSRSIDEMIRAVVADELDRALDESPLVQSIRDLTEELGRLTAGLAGLTGERADAIGTRSKLRLDAAKLEASFRPDEVRVLFVAAHSSIATPEHTFYLANSHLFRCIRGAFMAAFGSNVPNDQEFLDYIRERGCWVTIIPDELRRGPGRPPRRELPDTAYLTDLLRQTQPEYVVAVRRAVRRPLLEAVQAAAFPTDHIVAVRTPRELWKPQFVTKLAAMLADPASEPGAARSAKRSGAAVKQTAADS